MSGRGITNKELLSEYLYYDDRSPVQYGSKSKLLGYLRRLFKNGDINRKQFITSTKSVNKLAEEIDLGTHFQHHPKKIEPFHYTLYPRQNQYFHMDLMDLSSYAGSNRGLKWILVLVNAQTKYLYFRLMKTKSAVDVSKALHSILQGISGLAKVEYRILIQCDNGKEFYNRQVKDVLKKFNNIHLYSTNSDHKAAFAESVIRTIRAPLVKSMEDKGPKWTDQIKSIVEKYNHGYHTTIKMSPARAETHFPEALSNIHSWQNRPIRKRNVSRKFHIGDSVRLLAKNSQKHFRKGTLRKWTSEIFTVVAVRRLKNKNIYKLADRNKEIIVGTFDDNQLQRASSQETYKFHILRTRTRNKEKEYFVNWDGFPATYNSWVKGSDLI